VRMLDVMKVAAFAALLPLGSSEAQQSQERWDVPIWRVGAETASQCYVFIPGANPPTTCINKVVYCRDGKNCESMCRILLAAKLAGKQLKRIQYEEDTNHLCFMNGLMFE